jgi:putative heme-binding domain-containing protein
MKQTITCVFAALLAVAHGQTDNLLPNPSFETNSASGVEGWLSRAWTGGDEARHEVLATGRNGGQCVSIRSANGSDAAWTAKVNALQGKTYELSGWIKTDGLKGAIGALLNIQNTSVKTTAVTGTSDWRRVGAVFVADRPELEINCLFGGWGNATGQAWFDEITLRELSEDELAKPKAGGFPGLNGLVAEPLMDVSKELPRRLMSVGVDDRGKVFVTETVRQMKEDISLLQSNFLHEADMALTTVAEKEAWILKNFSPQIAAAQGVQDFNKDGVVDVKDLTVRSEKIFTLNDANKDGLFDEATLFAEGFNSVTTGVAHSVAPIGYAVYATILPDVWKLRDANGDGRAESRELLAHGFANHIGYGNHDLHSVVRGYDGKLYWSMGDRGFNVVSKEGKRFSYPNTGAILRCNADGSGFEVFASGLRNCQYFDFDDYGNLFSVDHDADFQGEMERLVFLPEGSDSGWRNYYQYRQVNRVLGAGAKDLYNPWLAEVMWKPLHSGQPSHFLPPIENSWNAPASFSYQPGQALGGNFRGHFLLGGVSSIRAFKMVADGATFRREGEDVVVDGLGQQVLASAFAPNGGLYFVIWDAPQGRPPLWVLRDPNQQGDVEKHLAQGFQKRSEDELAVLLGHEDRRLRASAQDELAARGKADVLKRTALDEKSPQLARIHALWGLTQLKRWDSEVARQLAKSANDEIQAQLARYLGDIGSGPAAQEQAAALLQHRSPRVKMLAAISCGRLRAGSATPRLLEMIEAAANAVPVLREAGVIGLMGATTPADLGKISSHPSAHVRIAAVVALRRLGATKELMNFLNDASPQVMSDAVLAIYDAADLQTFEKTPEALQAIAEKLTPSATAPINVRALAANRRLGTREALARIAAFLTAPNHPQQTERIMAIDLLASWSNPVKLDPVDGRSFPVPAFSADDLATELAPHLAVLANDPNTAIAERAISLFAKMKVTGEIIAHAAATILDDATADPLRSAWFQWLQKKQPERADQVAVTALDGSKSGLSIAAANHLLDRNLEVGKVRDFLTNTLSHGAKISQQQAALGLLKRVPGSEVILRPMMENLRAGKLAATIQLDVIEAARTAAAKDAKIASLLAEQDASASAESSVALEGGDAERGKSLFLGHTAAMCSKCHALENAGQQIGPSLAGVATRLTRAELLESMLDPQAKVAPGYGIQILELNDGTTVTGTQMSESNEDIVIKSPDGKLTTHPKATVKTAGKPIGVMPPMKALLTTREMRDLVEFLSSLNDAE